MKKKIWTEEKITEEILKVVKLLNLERMPSLAEYQINASGGYDALIRYGGMKRFSKVVNLPVERKIRQKRRFLHTCKVCGKQFTSTGTTTICCSEKCRVERRRERERQRYQEKSLRTGAGIRPSGAFKKERELRKNGLHYRDAQVAETLAMVGSIDTSRYGVEKVRAL